MSRVLTGLKPERVFEIFEDICSIPHGSGNTKAISDYCADFAKRCGLWYSQDNLNNIIIKKPAFKGYENAEPVVLQGHLDMVCEKENGVDFDFERDGLKLKVDGDFVSAAGTTLGGDDGIAVAIALSILEDKSVRAPEIQVIFTTDEETGMYGAVGIDVSCITAKKFINIDSEDEGIFTVGCAGGARVDIKLPLKSELNTKPAYTVQIKGLTGGHSGTEINKGRLNANKLLGKFLSDTQNVQIGEIKGGNKDNAIPVFASCTVVSDSDIISKAAVFEESNRVPEDNELTVTVTPCECERLFDLESSKKIIGLINSLPFGVVALNPDIEGLVETSLNIGIIRSDENEFSVSLSVRSSKRSQKEALIDRLKTIGESYGAAVSVRGDYPAWEYRKCSTLRDKMNEVFEKMYGKKPKIEIIHAGLECGLFGEKIKDIDAVSIGPDLFDIHTPRERLSISSVKRTYEFICCVLEELK